MKIIPYLHFNGNCAQAIALYEKAFGVQAQVLRYKDTPPSEDYQPPAGTEDFVMHACLTNRNDYTIYLCDMPPETSSSFGNGMSISVELDSKEKVQSAFEVLKEHGAVGMDPQQTFWSPYFASLTDQFGVAWMISMEYCEGAE